MLMTMPIGHTCVTVIMMKNYFSVIITVTNRDDLNGNKCEEKKHFATSAATQN